MALLSWLNQRTPDIYTPAPPPPRVTQRPSIPEPQAAAPDDPEMEAIDESGELALEPIYGMIDYCDSRGQETRRRITLQKLKTGRNGHLLQAICHERKALRSFRCDRIECFITDDGEVIETAEFFREHLFIELGELAAPNRNAVRKPEVMAPRAIRDELNAALFVLVAAAKTDGEFHPEEIDAICIYIEDELNSEPMFSRFRDAITIELLDGLTDMVRRIRPQRRTLAEHIATISRFDEVRLARFRKALEKVVMADGKFVAPELSFVFDFEELCAGYPAAE
ncbi:hypothetical protein PVT71_14645 [Salipiger sp. H15]|uniref:WYL domain-containing protein n=1 Tax=Alloyangia sp. H15 TaxID=3029062 RepID=A0AAU8ALY2_9RHOB